ncbi:MAG: hypothetical protein U0797_23760 [Gemmataceae bacterium]
MTLPASFLQHVEQHGCFSGCYGSDSSVSACLDPARPLAPLLMVSCQDCLARIAVPAALMPHGTSSYGLARMLTDHLRMQRGFSLSVSGYHVAGPGFWLSAVYYPTGLFLVSGERSRQLGSDLDLLQLAFQHGVVQPQDPRMRDPKQYAVETVYVNFASCSSGVTTKQSLLASAQCRAQPRSGWQKVTLAEFLLVSQARPAAAGAAAAKPAGGAKALKVGDICPVCRGEVRVRPLLVGSYVGCLC